MEKKLRILIIDKAADRKKRITALKERGYAVYPALKISEARNRCKTGSYDLIVVNSEEALNEAIELCQVVQQRSPHQPVLLMGSADEASGAREYSVSSDPERLVERVEQMLGSRTASTLSLAA